MIFRDRQTDTHHNIYIIIITTGRGDETTPGKPRPLGAAWLGQERQQGGGAHHHHHLLSQQYHYKDIHFVNSTLLTLVDNDTYLEGPPQAPSPCLPPSAFLPPPRSANS